MNETTQPIGPIETSETPDGIENELTRIDAHAAVTAAETAVAPEANARTVTVAAEEAESTVPDAVKQTDASRRALEQRLASARARGVEWVRASDLLSRGTGRMAGAGIRLHQAAGTQTRRGLANGVRAVSRRVRELPPVSAFGRRTAAASGAVRSGVGMR
jgi:hypothetical protein